LQLDKKVLFNLGVELGRELQKLQIEEYVLPVWESLNNKKKHEEKVRVACEKIEELITILVRQSVKNHIEMNGNWSISKDGQLEEFDKEIVDQYNIQILDCSMHTYGGDFRVSFNVVGKLQKLFEKFDIVERFTVSVNNKDGEEEQSFHDTSRIDRDIRGVSLVIRQKNEWPLEKFDECLNEIQKTYLFAFIKNN